MSEVPVVRNNEAKSRFEIALDDGDVAFAEYRLVDDRVVFPHTLVPRAHQGHGLAAALAKAALAWARQQGLMVVPRCEFFVAYIKRHPEHQDLLHPAG